MIPSRSGSAVALTALVAVALLSASGPLVPAHAQQTPRGLVGTVVAVDRLEATAAIRLTRGVLRLPAGRNSFTAT